MPERVPELVLYDFHADPKLPGYASFSPFVLLAHRALTLAGLPFRHQRLPFQHIGRVNPTRQLPVLKLGDELVPDSTEILRRIEQLAPGSLRGGLSERAWAEAWLWEEFADTALYPQVLATRWADERGWAITRPAYFGGLPPVVRSVLAATIRKRTLSKLRERDFLRRGLSVCEARLNRVLDHLEQRAPESGFWLGAQPSVADLGLFAHLHSLRLPTTPFRAEDIAQRRVLSAWLDRVDAATRG